MFCENLSQLLSVQAQNAGTMTDKVQINALIDLYKSTNGDNWTHNNNWDILFKNSTTVSDVCNPNRYLRGIVCVNSNIQKLGLPNNNLNGTIPPSLCNLITHHSVWINFKINPHLK